MEALRAILERCGESLVAGWNRAIAIISSVFERSGSPPDRQDDEETHIDWPQVSKNLVSLPLGRTAFAATQLICSDFLSALSAAVVPSLIELLYRFASQGEDLNTALTTVTLAWNVSDFLLGDIAKAKLDAVARQVKEADDDEEEILSMVRDSTSAQWLLLLLRLREIVRTSHKEVRKAAFQTTCSVFKNSGDHLTPGTWDLTLRSIILRISMSDALLYHQSTAEDIPDGGKVAGDENMSIAIISGTSEVISQHLRLIEQVAQLPSLWEAFLSRLEAYLNLESHPLNAAIYQALTRVLSQIDASATIWSGPMYRTLHLWLKRNPATLESNGKEPNQEGIVAYVEAGTQLYRLTQQSMSVSQTRTLVENLYLAIRHSDEPRYGADVNNMSALQSKALDLLKSVRSDTPSTLVVVAAKLVTLHHDTAAQRSPNNGPTFVAIVSEAIDWLQVLVLEHIADMDLFETGGFSITVQSLRCLIERKYAFPLEHKGVPLWRKATSTAIQLSGPLLEQCQTQGVDTATKISIWTEYVHIAAGVVQANDLGLVEDEVKIFEDQMADIESFKALREVLIPRLGDPDLPDSVRLVYARSLFVASIIHPTEPGELPENEMPPIENIEKIRRGRVKRVPYSQREKMCYECLSELIALARKTTDSVERQKLARAAAPLLILRLAIPIRAYVADQPLRGRRPQPLSELEELLFCFEAIKKLKLNPDALAADPITAWRTGESAHLHFLYPLLARAVGTAGDRWSGAEEVLTPLQSVLQAITPVP